MSNKKAYLSVVGTSIFSMAGMILYQLASQGLISPLTNISIDYHVIYRDTYKYQLLNYTTNGKISINESNFEYFYTDSNNISTYYVNNFLYTNNITTLLCLGHVTTNDWSSAINIEPEKNLTVITNNDLNVLSKDKWFDCSGTTYYNNIFNTDIIACVINKDISFVAGKNFKIIVDKIHKEFQPIKIDENKIDNSACMQNSTTSNRRRLGVTSREKLQINPINKFWEEKKRKLATNVFNRLCFIHGMGMNKENGFDVVTRSNDDLHLYWDYVPVKELEEQGYIVKFISYNTYWNSWKTPEITQKVFDWIVNEKCSQVYAHSMGNLVMNAINHRILNDNSFKVNDIQTLNSNIKDSKKFIIRWNNIGGPLRGSWIANDIEDICLAGNVLNPLYWGIVNGLSGTGGYCIKPNGKNQLNPATESNKVIKPTCNKCSYWTVACSFVKKEINGYHKTPCANGYSCCDNGKSLLLSNSNTIPLEKLLLSSMCGNSAYGITSIYGLGLSIVSAYAGFGDIIGDDGFVAFNSCKDTITAPFTNNFNSDFYTASLNHADLAFYTNEDTTMSNDQNIFRG